MILFDLFKLFSPTQFIILIVILVALIGLIVGNVLIYLHYLKKKKRILCTEQLQQKREELLQKLDAMKTNPITIEEQEEADEEEELPSEDLEADDEVIELQNDFDHRLRILAVKDMSLSMRQHFELTDVSFDDKSYYVRYEYSFEAKLRNTSEENKGYFDSILSEIAQYKGLKVSLSYKQLRIYKGLKTLGILIFRGKTLCVCLALDPKEFEQTKYRGKDMSSIKRFAQFPMLLRLSSKRKVEYAKYLLLQVAEANMISLEENPKPASFDLSSMTMSELFDHQLVKITLNSQVKE